MSYSTTTPFCSTTHFFQLCMDKNSSNPRISHQKAFPEKCVFYLLGIVNLQISHIGGAKDPNESQQHEVHSKSIILDSVGANDVIDQYSSFGTQKSRSARFGLPYLSAEQFKIDCHLFSLWRLDSQISSCIKIWKHIRTLWIISWLTTLIAVIFLPLGSDTFETKMRSTKSFTSP